MTLSQRCLFLAWEEAQHRYRIAPHGLKLARLKELQRITRELLCTAAN